MFHHGESKVMIERRSAFSLVELLVVIGIVGTLIALLIPAVQASRASASRMACSNNMRQLGIALQHHESALRRLPSGAVAKEYPPQPNFAWTFYRWSALAQLTPYLDESVVYDALEMTVPLYVGNPPLISIWPDNEEAVKLVVAEFLCPSDVGTRVHERFGPTNYAVCTGTGAGGGTPLAIDGAFFVNSQTRMSEFTDGTSRTIVLCEGLLGPPPPGTPAAPPSTYHDPQREYKFVLSAPITEERCGNSVVWNYQDPLGFAWVNGEYRSALYNHYATPNSAAPDCMGVQIVGAPPVRYTPYGWRAARSRHTGGVNALLADGSVRFVGDGINLSLWQAFATIAGGETVDVP
jgi:prepilin-type processing-associated H-X9-DG protein